VRAWFDETVAGDEPFAIPDLVWASFLRLTTNRRIFEVPTPRAHAFAFIEAACARPVRRGRRGRRPLPDAVIGAVAVEYSCEHVTLDRDFARFPSVRHFRPPST
jgi:uncharacterized protein